MRIAIVASDYAPTVGGVQTAVRNIAHHAARMGHCVTILSYQPAPNVPHVEVVDGITVHRFPWGRRPLATLPWRALVTLWEMARALRAFKPDLVYIHFLSINALYVLLLHYLMHFKLVASARGNDIQGIPARSRGQRWMLANLFRQADGILFCSSFVQRDAESYLRNARRDAYIGVVGDGFSAEEYAGVSPYDLGAPFILAVGRLVHKKGFDLLINAFSRVSPDFPDVHLVIAGDGEERASLEGQVQKVGLTERAHLLGFPDRPTTLALFLGCEFFVLSSRIEPFGIVVLEAMAARKAVLATRSGGVVDLIQPEVNGWLVEPSVDALAGGMRKMLAHSAETQQIGARAVETIQMRSWAGVTEEFMRVFEQVVKR